MTDDWAPPAERLTKTTIIVGLSCFIVFIVGVLIQQLVEGPDGYVELLRSCINGSTVVRQCEAAINGLHEHSHTFAHTSFLLALAESFKALSIAVLASLVVTNTAEKRNRKRLNDALGLKARQISINVFEGLFGNSHPPATLDTIKRILEKPLLRERLDVTYTLSLWKGEGDSRVSGKSYVKVDVALSSTTRNIANPRISSAAVVDLPIALSLPNPLIDELKPFVKIKRVAVGGADIGAEKLLSANTALQAALQDDSLADAQVSIDSHQLKPGDVVRIEAEYSMMKEFEDTEVLRSFHLTEMVTLTVIDRTGEDFAIRARAIHSGTLNQVGNTESFLRWELEDIILPQQGIMVWWKKTLDSGSAVAQEPVEPGPAGRGTHDPP